MYFNISHSPSGDLLIALQGEFDALGTSSVRAGFEQVANTQGPALVVLDLSAVSFIDSSGVGAIVYLFKRLRAADRGLELVGVHGQVRELLELLRVHKALPVNFLDVAAGTAGVAS
jgi:anti-anti-sigma factor